MKYNKYINIKIKQFNEDPFTIFDTFYLYSYKLVFNLVKNHNTVLTLQTS